MRILLGVTAAALALCASACLRKTDFKCTADPQCGKADGVCEADGYCSFTDSACTSGRRYGDYSGPMSGQCVSDDGGSADAGVDAIDAPPTCPDTYTVILGAPGHLYRLITTPATWDTQKSLCGADGAAAYLAIPGDQAELAALTATGGAARLWVGIDDQVTEGTYVTTRGGTIATTDPMWDTGEPNNSPPTGGGQADCVIAIQSNMQLADDSCAKTYPAICECEP